MEQPLMLQSDCIDCKHYEGFGQCFEHGNNLVENCRDYKKENKVMKANVPEKIYCTPAEGGLYFTTIKPEPPFAEGVEYTRTDAFIEKACEFWKDHLAGYDIYDDDIERSIESFKLAMKL